MDTDATRILILGMAREGVSLARYFAARGADVTVTDVQPADRLQERVHALSPYPVRLVLGDDYPELVGDAQRFFVSPGVPEGNPVFAQARRLGRTVESMTTLFFELCPGRITGITGSSGKTTTTGLLGHILRAAGRDVVVGGNIGSPMLDLLPAVKRTTNVVLELSSFQLSLLRRSPQVAVVTNITPNHLDRHGTMDDYITAKRQIVAWQQADDVAVLNAGDPAAAQFSAATPARKHWFGLTNLDGPGAAVRETWAGIVDGGAFEQVLPVQDIPLIGQHNVENVLAALAAAHVLGVPGGAMADAVRAFRPAPHRLQVVAVRGGVRYIDDSIATSPARASVALQALSSPVLLIAGGRDKRLPWNEFAALAVQRARAVLLIGEAGPLIEEALRDAIKRTPGTLEAEMIIRCPSLGDAVCTAGALAGPGDTVLLSPGCTSYDMFTNYEERGLEFARAVELLDAA